MCPRVIGVKKKGVFPSTSDHRRCAQSDKIHSRSGKAVSWVFITTARILLTARRVSWVQRLGCGSRPSAVAVSPQSFYPVARGHSANSCQRPQSQVPPTVHLGVSGLFLWCSHESSHPVLRARTIDSNLPRCSHTAVQGNFQSIEHVRSEPYDGLR